MNRVELGEELICRQRLRLRGKLQRCALMITSALRSRNLLKALTNLLWLVYADLNNDAVTARLVASARR